MFITINHSGLYSIYYFAGTVGYYNLRMLGVFGLHQTVDLHAYSILLVVMIHRLCRQHEKQLQGVFNLVDEVKGWERIWQNTLDILPNGLLVLGSNLNVKFINKEAKSILENEEDVLDTLVKNE